MQLTEALSYALELADALRCLHNEGQAHGAVTPDAVLLAPSGLQLLPAEPDAIEALVPYIAPERLQGHAPDACTDIFAFGAVLYEMLTGQHAFEGDTAEALADAITNSNPAPIGDAQLNRLVTNCLAKERAARWQRMQQVVMELKLFSASTWRKTGASLRVGRIETSLRTEMQQIEACLATQLERHKKSVADLLSAADEEISRRQSASLQALAAELNSVRADLGDFDEHVAVVRQGAAQAVEAAHNEIEDLRAALAAQAAALESVQSTSVRTDDLVERVVETLECLQGIVFEKSDEHSESDQGSVIAA
jgi:serine/threonine protein kinase